MNSVMKSTIPLPIAAMFVAASLALPLAAQKEVPFSGSLQGTEVDTPQGGPPPSTLSVEGSLTGTGSHVGEFTFTYQLTVTLADGTANGTAELVAANGDSIFTTVDGSSEETDTPGVVRITEINTITGGTGRFAGAKGGFTVERLLTQATGFTSGAFHGTITPPGAVH